MKGSQAHKNVLCPQPETLFPIHTLGIRALSLVKGSAQPEEGNEIAGKKVKSWKLGAQEPNQTFR